LPAAATTRQLRISFLFALVMLIAQFLLGMAVNRSVSTSPTRRRRRRI